MTHDYRPFVCFRVDFRHDERYRVTVHSFNVPLEYCARFCLQLDVPGMPRTWDGPSRARRVAHLRRWVAMRCPDEVEGSPLATVQVLDDGEMWCGDNSNVGDNMRLDAEAFNESFWQALGAAVAVRRL